MKIYVLTEAVDHWGVEVLGVYSSKEKAVKVFYELIVPGLEPRLKPEKLINEYILEFDLDLDPKK